MCKDYKGEPYVVAVDKGSIEDALVRMAEWKDDELRKLRNEQITRINAYHDYHKNIYQEYHALGAVLIIDRFLGEDSRDELHCAFATMD